MSKALVFVFLAECWTTIGQICLKKSANRLNIERWIVLRYPALWIGAAAMLAGMVFWLWALGSGELSYVYLLGSIQYIFALFASYFFLHEKIDTPKLAGTLLITLGVILTAIS